MQLIGIPGYMVRAYYPLLCCNMNTLSYKGDYAHVSDVNGQICPYKLVITVSNGDFPQF